jgi:protein subunit release factor B
METETKPVLTLTASDFVWSYTKGSGAGGQKRNKTSSAVHCKHAASGAHGYSEGSRSQHDNKREAFERCVETKQFKDWLKLETMRRTGEAEAIEQEVTRQLNFVKVEVQREGKWVEVEKSAKLDDTAE